MRSAYVYRPLYETRSLRSQTPQTAEHHGLID